MRRIGTVDERYQSYNVEMAEVTGGSFWKPYGQAAEAPASSAATSNQSVPAGMNPDIYQYRPPIDLSNSRRRKLAAALGPAYVRVSGTWANTTYFFDADGAPPKEPPAGFNAILTRSQWKGVVDFSRAVDAKIVSSVAIGPGTRNASGVWTPAQTRALYAYTKSVGGAIAATEFMNEPTVAAMGGAPKGYDAADYGRDLHVFRAFLKKFAPGVLLVGPGSVGEGGSLAPPASAGVLESADLLKAAGPVFDVFSYHYYGAVSRRCSSLGGGTIAAQALSEKWLSGTDAVETFYARLRDEYDPGKPLWITEMADAACGGNPWAATFLDSFRYLDQLGRLAQRGVKVVFHNTLDSSDYGLLDENTLAPRPNYWAALLWRTFMGTGVLDPGPSPVQNLHVYAHCLRHHPGGVALLVINTDRDASHSLDIATASRRYTLTARKLEDPYVRLNGKELRLGADDALPMLPGVATSAGRMTFAPISITFLAMPQAGNATACSAVTATM